MGIRWGTRWMQSGPAVTGELCLLHGFWTPPTPHPHRTNSLFGCHYHHFCNADGLLLLWRQTLKLDKKAKQYTTHIYKPQKFCSSKAVTGTSVLYSEAIRKMWMSNVASPLAAGRMSTKANSANVTLNRACYHRDDSVPTKSYVSPPVPATWRPLHMKQPGCNSTWQQRCRQAHLKRIATSCWQQGHAVYFQTSTIQLLNI